MMARIVGCVLVSPVVSMGCATTQKEGRITIQGHVEPGFELVQTVFEENFRQRGEIGAACCVYLRGRRVVDLWGGYRDEKTRAPWTLDTIACVFSTTKGMAAAGMMVAHSRGYFEIDEPVATYWPEFGAHGNESITVRQLFAHQAGLSVIDQRITPEAISDMDRWACVLARQRPQWTPGIRHGYHGLSLGFFQNELLRRTDPKGRSLGVFFHDEIAAPLDADFYIGLPGDFPSGRMATIKPFSLLSIFMHPGRVPVRFLLAMMWPWSVTHRSLMKVDMHGPGDIAEMRWLQTEFPSATGAGSARGLARIYGALAWTDPALRLNEQTRKDVYEPAILPPGGGHDLVLHTATAYSWGFVHPCPTFRFGGGASSFGAAGAGGSQAFGDPEMGLGFAYVMNRMSVDVGNDPRAVALTEAVYESIAALAPANKSTDAAAGYSGRLSN